MKKFVFPILLSGILTWGLLSCGSADTANAIKTDSLSIFRGGAIFQQNCSGCHGFENNSIGPALAGVTKTDSLSWLKSFIRGPKSLIDQGDEHAKKLFARYHSLMPSFTAFTEDEMNQLIAFLNIHKDDKKEEDDPLAILDPVPEKIASSNIQLNLQLVSQIPASSDKDPHTRISKMNWNGAMNAWIILDQRGKLYKLVNSKAIAWLDISKWKSDFINQPGLATGLGSFAFHPEFARNGIFYTTHTEKAHTKKADFPIADTVKQLLQWVLCEWKLKDPAATEFNGTCRELLRIDMVTGIHGVQEIIFNPQSKPGDEDYGQLFIGVGDGGSVENKYAFLTRHPDKVWGTILRINPLGNNSANKQYGISSKNPFFNSTDSNAVREIYAYGFRNPNRITWTTDHLMLATNIGQANIESINIILKGHNYGWPIREGKFMMHPNGNINNLYPLPPDDSSFHITYPVAVFDHDEGKAIAGGFEYKGKSLPELTGLYLFGDIPSGRLFYTKISDFKLGQTAEVKEWFVSLNGKRLSLREICGNERVDLRFAQDDNGEIYIFTKPDGKIYRLIK